MMIESRILKHLTTFMHKCKLFPAGGIAYCAVSGGRDSVFLLHCLSQIIPRQQLVVLHFNHGSRAGCSGDEKLVERLAAHYQLEIVIFRTSLKKDAANFESRAREYRAKMTKNLLKKGDTLYQGHHIDDSFEWHLMQSFRSSSFCLGIPTKNGKIYRPLMCFGRQQITKFCRLLNLTYRDDSSNQDSRFDRNFIRQTIIPAVASRYPQYLKHYNDRMNQLALVKAQSLLAQQNHLAHYRDSLQHDCLYWRNFKNDHEVSRESIQAIIQKLSSRKRGVTSQQISKLFLMMKKGRGGPLTFSGQVQAYTFKASCLFLGPKQWKQLTAIDQQLTNDFKAKNLQQVTKSLKDLQDIMNRHILGIPDSKSRAEHSHVFPFYLISDDNKSLEKILPSQKSLDPIWKQLSQHIRDCGFWYRPLPELISKAESLGLAPSHKFSLLM